VTDVRALAAAFPQTIRAFGAELPTLDAVLVFGPHPVALAFALQTRRADVPLVLGVRHDYPEYVRHRVPGHARGWAVPAARAIDVAFRRMARTSATAVVGPELRQRYERAGGHVLELSVSLVPAREIVAPEHALARDWTGDLRCLSVGRLAPEKNPLMLVDTIAALRERDARWRLVVAGDGPLRDAVEAAVATRGLEHAVDVFGEVTNGPWLWKLYRSSHAFLHVSLTEGLPQVLVEANAAGTPVVATDVGSVGEALSGRGLLVPPRDPHAAAAALERLAREPLLRRSLVLAGLDHARRDTLEAQVERLAEFIELAAPPPATPRPRQPRRVPPRATGSARTRATGTSLRSHTRAAQGTASPPD
jgi:glycosyltransferase involved in cell wall biosynthesis